LSLRNNPSYFHVHLYPNVSPGFEGAPELIVEYHDIWVDPFTGTPWGEDDLVQSNLILATRSSNPEDFNKHVQTKLVKHDNVRVVGALGESRLTLPPKETLLIKKQATV